MTVLQFELAIRAFWAQKRKTSSNFRVTMIQKARHHDRTPKTQSHMLLLLCAPRGLIWYVADTFVMISNRFLTTTRMEITTGTRLGVILTFYTIWVLRYDQQIYKTLYDRKYMIVLKPHKRIPRRHFLQKHFTLYVRRRIAVRDKVEETAKTNVTSFES